MNEFPMIDILLATYNGEKYLEEQIESILSQTYSNINIIVSDDGSTDSTIDILKSYCDLPNFKVYYNSFGNSNENFGFLISVSENEYIAFSDQDDVWFPTKIEKCIDTLVNDQSLLVYSDLYYTDDKLNIVDNFSNVTNVNNHHSGEFSVELIFANSAPGCTILAKSEIVKSILPMNKIDVIHDWKLMFVASINGKISYIDEPLIYYRQHSSNQVGTGKNGFAFGYSQRKLLDQYITDNFIENQKIKVLKLYPVKKIRINFKAISLILKSDITSRFKISILLYFCFNFIYSILAKIYMFGKRNNKN